MSDGGGDALAQQQQQQQQQQLIQLLTACVSPDERTRKDAERMVQSSGAVFGFEDLLCRTAFGLDDDVVDGHHHLNIPMDIRQLAALLLKKYVRERWQVGEHFFIEGEPMTSVEEKM